MILKIFFKSLSDHLKLSLHHDKQKGDFPFGVQVALTTRRRLLKETLNQLTCVLTGRLSEVNLTLVRRLAKMQRHQETKIDALHPAYAMFFPPHVAYRVIRLLKQLDKHRSVTSVRL